MRSLKQLLFSALLCASLPSIATICDVDVDNDIDRLDINQIFAARGAPATGPQDPRDADQNGVISALDGRICATRCSEARCAIVTPDLNTAPVAQAGNDQAFKVGSQVQLDGSGSSDADGDLLSYAWTFLQIPAGSNAVLSDASAVMPSFDLDVTGDYIIQLIVNDGTISSAPDTVTISTENSAPLANAGPDQTALVFDFVTLDGSGSDDANNDSLSFSWSIQSRPAGSTASLDDPFAVMPSFTIDEAGDYLISLVVNDGLVNSLADTVTVSTLNSPPVANLGNDQSVSVGELVLLSGINSSDVDRDPLTYRWALLSRPASSFVTLNSTAGIDTSFTVDAPGDYVVQLVVNDGQIDSAPATVVISTRNTAPRANAGPDASAFLGEQVVLNGTASSDIDGDPISYLWSFIQRPSGSIASLSDNTVATPSFVIDVTGDYVLSLVVNDGQSNSQPDSVTISTDNTAPVANAGPDQTPQVNDNVTLDGSLSTDVNGDPLGFLWRFIDNPGGSNAQLSDANSVNPSFTVDLAGRYEVELIVNDGALDSAPDSVVLTTTNSMPVANAGADVNGLVGDTVMLDGTASSDVDGDALSYAWSFLSTPLGSAASLSDRNASMPSFVIDEAGSYQIQLIVNDGNVDSLPDVVSVSTDNTAPVANAGSDLTPFVNDLVTLDGSASSDVDGDALSYAWSLTTRPAGSAATLNDTTLVMPSFTADTSGRYVAQLIVNDGALNSNVDTVAINTLNTPPSANAGPDQLVDLNDTALLDGSASTDVDGDPLSYNWSITSRPSNSNAALDDPSLVNPQFTVDQIGDYVVQLVVNDGNADSPPDTVILSTANVRPVADAGANQTPEVGDTVSLDGSASFDADGDPLTYAWSITSRPANSSSTLSSPNSVSTDFVVDEAGVYVVQLIVNDGQLSSVPNTLVLDTQNRPPQANAGADQSSVVNQVVSLSGAASSDPDGDSITYQWAITSAPNGSTATLINANTVSPTLTPDVAGDYTIELIVNDGDLDSSADTVLISVDPEDIVLSIGLSSTVVGVGRTSDVDVILSSPAPAGGIEVSLSSSNLSVASVSPASSRVAEGQSQATFNVSGLGAGSVILTASAAGLSNSTASLSVTNALISLGTLESLAPGQMQSIALSISSPAPAGGLVVNLSSSNSGIASITPSVTIPQGAQVPAQNPIVTGDQIGTTRLSAAAVGFAPDSIDVEVSATLTFDPVVLNITEGETGSATLQLSAPAPSGGLSIDLVSNDISVATVPASVVIGQGELSTTINITSVSIGSASITAQAAGLPSINLPVTVSNGPAINLPNGLSIGNNLQSSASASLAVAAPAGNTQVTLTSSDPSRVLLSAMPNVAGSASITLQVNAGSTSVSTYYVQALASSGSAVITATADGYSANSFEVNLTESSAIIASPSAINTTPFSNNTSVLIRTYRLNAAGQIVSIQGVRGGFSVDMPISTSDSTIGVMVDSNLTITGGESFVSTEFDPVSAGTTTINLGQATGLNTATVFQSIDATVTGASINVANTTVGEDLQSTLSVTLQSAPPVATDIVLTSSDPSRVLLSLAQDTPGSSSVTLSGVTTAFAGTIYVQGIAKGSTNIVATGTGFSNGTSEVTVGNSGFIFDSPSSVSTDIFANDSNLIISSYLLRENNSIQARQSVRAGLNVDVNITIQDPAVGSISPSPVTFSGGDGRQTINFSPSAAGTSTIEVNQPTGFDTPSNFVSIPVEVTAPTIRPGIGAATEIGENLQISAALSLSSAPPSARDFTISSSDPSVILLSRDANTVGASSVVINGASTFLGTYFLQGIAQGSADITVSATDFTPVTVTVNVGPSGFIFQSPSAINTTVFSPNTNILVQPYSLTSTLGIRASQALRAGLTADLTLTIDNPTVGSFTVNPLAFGGADRSASTQFDPAASGLATVSIVQPSGFSTPTSFTSIGVEVSAPDIRVGDITVGKDLQASLSISLESAPPSPIDVEVTISAETLALLSTDANVVGQKTVTFSNVTSAFVGTLFVQGLQEGDTTIEAMAPGYNSDTSLVSVQPSGFAILTPGDFTTITTTRSIRVAPYRLNPSTLNIVTGQSIRAGLTVDVSVLNSQPSVGALSPTTLRFENGSRDESTSFTPISPGQTLISVQTPVGFSSASNFTSITATVNP